MTPKHPSRLKRAAAAPLLSRHQMYRSIPDGEEGPPGRLRRAGEGEEEVVAAGITSGWAFAGNIGEPLSAFFCHFFPRMRARRASITMVLGLRREYR